VASCAKIIKDKTQGLNFATSEVSSIFDKKAPLKN
jgi:hypothetical protein